MSHLAAQNPACERQVELLPNRREDSRTASCMVWGFCFALLSLAANSPAAQAPKRVLLLNSYGPNFSPFSAVVSTFQTELAERSRIPIEVHEVSLEGGQFAESDSDEPTIKYLQALFRGRHPDLVVPCGGPAVRFALRERAHLFPSAPLLLAAVEARHLKTFTLDTSTTAVPSQFDFPDMIKHLLWVLPGTTNIAFVLGSSALEWFWKQELQRDLAGFTNRLGLTWLDQYTLEEMRERVRHLPPHTVLFYNSVFVDAAGVPHEYDGALTALRTEANAPITGMFEEDLGLGIIGGPLLNLRALGRQTALVAIRILNGETPSKIHTPPATPGPPVYDWRELRRWNISEERLPPGSIVKYQARTVWERYRLFIIGGLAVVLLQSVWILGLGLSRSRTRKAERSLRESEERMRLAASAAALEVWEWDLANHKPQIDAQAGGSSPGAKVSKSEHLQFLGTVHPADRDAVLLAVAKATTGDGNYEQVYRQMLEGGKVRWLAARGRFEFDAQHRLAKMRGVAIDITARKLAEEQARESEREFLLIANSAPVLIWTSGPDKMCTFFNQPWLQFRGRTLEQELGAGWTEGVHPQDLPHCLKTYTESFDARQPFTMEYRLRRHDGEFRWLSDHGVPRFDSQNQFLGYIGSCVDVSERKEAEAEVQRSQQELAHVSRLSTLGALAGSLAHELNQPLTSIVFNAKAAKRFMAGGHTNEHEVRDALEDIAEQGLRAGEIIQGLRALLKKDLGQMASEDVNQLVRGVIEMLHSDLVIRGVTPVLQLDPLLPAVNGHGVQLRQVVLNLVMNACDAMSEEPAEGRKLTIESRRVAANQVEVSVADTGPGFPEEMLEHPFEPFHTTKAKGLGLGLTICRSIMTAHGGRLEAVNNRDKGATVTLTLPAQPANAILLNSSAHAEAPRDQSLPPLASRP